MKTTPAFVLAAYPEVRAGGFSRVDGTVQFYGRVNALVSSRSVVLDFGAGRGAAFDNAEAPFRQNLRDLRGRVRKVIGVDIDTAVKQNPSLDEALLINDDGTIPMPDASVDVIVSDYVFEHLSDPTLAARELSRVLRSGGWLCVRTPNRYGYVPIASHLTPDRLKTRVLLGAQKDRKEIDHFKTYYRLNTPRVLREAFPDFQMTHYFWDAEPAYHGGYRLAFWTFYLTQFFTPPMLRSTILAFMQKRTR
jgi:SAM-dependent methyltransferase